jgi:hypothetical protein
MERKVKNLTKKTSIVALLFTFALLVPMADAAFNYGNINVYLWADKTQYNPGDSITLYFTIYNARSSDIRIDQIYIETPWLMYIRDHWEGNQTMVINKTITAGTAYSNSITIQIPNDSRAPASGTSIDVHVTIKTSVGTLDGSYISVNMANLPLTVSGMNNLILPSAVLIILIVVCTALIVVSIFLSTRKSQKPYAPS